MDERADPPLERATDFKQREVNDEDDEDEDDGPASRLVAQLLAFLLRGFQAKSKIARYRCVQLVALMINSLGEIECVQSSFDCVSLCRACADSALCAFSLQ